MNDQGRREVEATRIVSLEQQIHNLNHSMERMAQQNQELSHKLMERMEHQHFDDKEIQEATRLGPDIKQRFRREKQGDSHGLGASTSRQTSGIGRRTVIKQEKRIQRM